MSIEISVQCDNLTCLDAVPIDKATDKEIRNAGYWIDKETGCHYCRRCAEKAKVELGV